MTSYMSQNVPCGRRHTVNHRCQLIPYRRMCRLFHDNPDYIAGSALFFSSLLSPEALRTIAPHSLTFPDFKETIVDSVLPHVYKSVAVVRASIKRAAHEPDQCSRHQSTPRFLKSSTKHCSIFSIKQLSKLAVTLMAPSKKCTEPYHF